MALLEEYNTLSYWKYGLGGAGLATIIAGVASSPKGLMNVAPVVIGAMIAVSSWIPHLMQADKLEQAVNVYEKPQ